MASGLIHSRVTKTLALPAFAIGYLYASESNLKFGLLMMIGCLLGLFLEPDLDIKLITISERRMKKIPVIGNLWYFIWLPYANFLPHRSLISHLPIISTLIRYLYLSVFLIPVWLMITSLTFSDHTILLDFLKQYQVEITYLIVGNMLSDFGHFTLDVKWIVLSNGKIKFL